MQEINGLKCFLSEVTKDLIVGQSGNDILNSENYSKV